MSPGELEVMNEDPLRNSSTNIAEYADLIKIKEEREKLVKINAHDSDNRIKSWSYNSINTNNLSAMDEWMDNYEKRNGVRKFMNHNTNNTQRHEINNQYYYVGQNGDTSTRNNGSSYVDKLEIPMRTW